MSRRLLTSAVVLITALVTIGCTGSKAPVCSSVEDLQASVDNAKQTQSSENGINELKSDLTVVSEDLQQVLDDAKAQYKSQVVQISNDVALLKEKIQLAGQSHSATDISAVTSTVKLLGTDVRKLADEVKSTC
ncbi:MAG: hypothetical protein ACJ74U_01045 [Jatrophihabitantaceae bacterium]